MEDRGYDHPDGRGAINSGEDIDWDEVRERLKSKIKQDFTWKGGLKRSKEGAVPEDDFFSRNDEYPSPSAMGDRWGPKDKWPEELGIVDKNTAEDVDVDPTDWGL